jgi:EAL domain-containing protein (putative c-di-GMP-specific phosphodiesterase class I)
MFPDIRRLRDAGIHVSIDQFAIGGPGARLLAEIAVDRVRLDRGLVPMIGRSARHETLLSACVHVARQLGAETIVDAVENQAQAEFLRDIGCDEAQGRLFGIPVPPEDFIDSCAGRPLGDVCGRVPLDLI